MSSTDEVKPMEGPFSPGWVAPTVKSSQTPKAENEVKSAKKTTPARAKATPKGRHTSPRSEFGYDDAYSVGGDDFDEGKETQQRTSQRNPFTEPFFVLSAAVRKVKTGTRRRSPKKKFQKAKQSFLAPTSCSTVRQRSKTAAFETTQTIKVEQNKTPTIPVSPHFRKVIAKSKEQMLTSEELLLQKLNQEKHAEAERISKAQKLYAVLKSRSSRRKSKLYGNTVLDSAMKPKTPVRQFVQPKKVQPAVQASAIKRGQDGLTLFEPFQFATDKRVTIAAPLTTPDRVRVMPAAELAQHFMKDSRSHGASSTAAKKLTIGQSPKLRTQKRGQYAASSKPRLPTQDERVTAEMNEINSHPFRARRLDRRIFDSAGELGVPKITAKPVTEPIEFEFRAEKRSVRVRTSTTTSTGSIVSPTKRSTTSFRAKPAPKMSKVLTKTKTVFKPTVAMSPKFNGGTRASVAPSRRQRVPFSLTTNTTTSTANEPLKLTEPKEFKFRSDNRGEYHKAQLALQVAQEQEMLVLARERKAQPMPDFNKPVFQPDLTNKVPSTEMKPFQLRSVARHSDAVCAFQTEITQLTTENTTFHARPIPATTYKPDYEYIEPTDHVPVVPLPMTLESERRALKRQEFDQVMGVKMAQLECMQETIAKQKLESENERIRQLRRKSVEEGGLMFKAKPIVTKDQYPTKFVPSVPLTTPLSPQLRTTTRGSNSGTTSTGNTSGNTSTNTNTTSSGKVSGLSGGAKRITTVSDKVVQQSTELTQALNAM